jgi:hypothetical protein
MKKSYKSLARCGHIFPFLALLWIRVGIRIEVISWIRILSKVTSRIRIWIGIKVMRSATLVSRVDDERGFAYKIFWNYNFELFRVTELLELWQ